MRAYAFSEFNGIGSVVDRPIPDAGEGQILVRVRAASANAVDLSVISGAMSAFLEHRLPLIPGQDYAGTVEAVGPGGGNLKVGDEVFGAVGKAFFGEGSWAEYVVANVALAKSRPANVTPLQAAALPIAGGAAIALVEAVGVKAGDVVAIVGAAGGVGSIAVALAHAAGARVVAVTRPQNADYVRSLGANEVVEAGRETVAHLRQQFPGGVDSLIDTYHDAQGLLELAGAIRNGGRAASPTARGAEEAFEGRPIEVSVVSAVLHRVDELIGLIEAGQLPLEIHTLPLADAGQALEAIASGTSRGKLVIIPT